MNNVHRKKILYIHHGKGLGGAPLSLLYLIQSLDKTKYYPIVLFLHNSEIVELYKKNNIEVVSPISRYDFPHTKIWWLRWYHLPLLLRATYDTIITYLWTAATWINKLQPAIVHLNTSSLIAWGAVAHRKNIPVVWHVREPLAHGYFGVRRWIIKHCVEKYATKIIPICHHDAQPWADSPKTLVLYNPVDSLIFDHTISTTAFIKEYNLDPQTPTILFLGGVSQEKGTLIILEIFEKLLLRLPEVHLLIAGYWNLESSFWFKHFFPAQQYRNKIKQALTRVHYATTILGPINNVPQVMAASQVIVFPATVGHFARPIIEAGFMKKPVIASNMPPLDELVINGQTGYLISPTDRTQWIEKLVYLLTHKNQQIALGNQAYEFCKKNYALSFYQEKMANIYAQLEVHHG
jgi:glycosyltransferase involved in cell wall biosynthesis